MFISDTPQNIACVDAISSDRVNVTQFENDNIFTPDNNGKRLPDILVCPVTAKSKANFRRGRGRPKKITRNNGKKLFYSTDIGETEKAFESVR